MCWIKYFLHMGKNLFNSALGGVAPPIKNIKKLYEFLSENSFFLEKQTVEILEKILNNTPEKQYY